MSLNVWNGAEFRESLEIDSDDRLLNWVWDGSTWRKVIEGYVWDGSTWREFYRLTAPPPPPPPQQPPPNFPDFDPWRAGQRWQRVQSPYVRGSDVLTTQVVISRVYNIGVGPLDGVYGNQTKSGVLAFQRARQILVDGIVGPQTWTELWGDRSRHNMYG